jgi:DNA-binding response OmpR family regulator
MRVLVVEDDEATVVVVTLVLEDEGYAVIAVRSVDAALAVAAACDVALVDGLVASLAELEAADAPPLRALAARVPVVVTSGWPWAREASPAELGVAAILPKPYELDDLLAAVRAAAGGA